MDVVVLAGYLKLIPSELVRAFKRRILNIHPALLPAFGGQGYYGARVRRRWGLGAAGSCWPAPVVGGEGWRRRCGRSFAGQTPMRL